MATWFEVTFTGEPTDADRERVAELVMLGFTSGQLLNESDSLVEPAQQAERTARTKAGDKFEHAHFLNPKGGSEPALCTVTAVVNDRVYFTYSADYEAGDRRGAWFLPLDTFATNVKRWVL